MLIQKLQLAGLSLLFCGLGVLLAAPLTPETQVIFSHYLEQKSPPEARPHRYNPLRPERLEEPYSPQVLLGAPSFPDDLPKNQRLHWLTRISGGLSSLFLGARGQFEAGVKLYEQEKYPQGKEKFLALYNKGKALEQEAALWLAWTQYRLGEMDESYGLARWLQNGKTDELRLEGYLLSALHLFSRGELENLGRLIDQAKAKLPPQVWDFRLKYVALVALVKLERWKEARDLLEDIESEEIRHSPFYGKVKEMAGVIAYYEDDFKRSLSEFERAKDADPRAFAKSENNRYIAWLAYLTGDLEKALLRVDEELNDPLPQNQEELTYLKITLLTHLGRGTEIIPLLGKLPKDSNFRSLSAFQVKAFYKDLEKLPALQRAVESVEVKSERLQLYITLLDGNRAFRQGDWAAAEKEYKSVLAKKAQGHYPWLAQYNLGQIELQKKDWPTAEKTFLKLKESKEPANKKWLNYHLLYALAQQRELEGFLKVFGTTDFSELDPEIEWEVQLLKGGLLLQNKRLDEAVATYLWGFEHGRRVEALEYAAQALYGANQLERVLALASAHRDQSSDLLLGYEIKSLLGLSRFQEAKVRLETRGFQGERLWGLHVEVWLNTGDYNKIIQKTLPLRAKPGLPLGTQKLYALALADTYFNQKDFANARMETQRALDLTQGVEERSPLLYSLVMSHYAEPGHGGYDLVSERILKNEPLTPPVRLNLTLLLANQEVEQGKLDLAETRLAKLEQLQSFGAGKVRVKRAALAASRADWDQCAVLGEGLPGETNEFERADLAYWGASCRVRQSKGKEALALLGKLSAPLGYRSSELALLSAQAYGLEKKPQDSQAALERVKVQDLAPEQVLQAQLQGADNLIRLGQPKEAQARLGDFRSYPQGPQRLLALRLGAKAQKDLGQLEEAAKSYLRLRFEAGLSDLEANQIRLELAETYLLLHRSDRALGVLKELDTQDPALLAQKTSLEAKAQAAATPSTPSPRTP
ncbi:MAG: hypothetical protein A2600_07980 [Candidatus Lambdaproteobacteria bacterium RIFOXYD1_FULL_56_27]|uniref:Uncharacterized protein n=1 Tax=Candidatus Lambdaproteobacteria bacterium RIFOXYD2_FULL_56_26 TaxID=1817773 RepID=A0A1F6GUN3_9PROT|nr:MAG: hypothetical protein A2426_11900 [Candidatus Lambdaproteobacteria bacterium RIFOXYC1_FULL_56_13]OGH01808.1 MAG: hypothetical protein A2557_01830 [Candidatus Lambdaproteobacteria bacterium RIFOXYD2_FULL_56_26]OGH07520.1 MAG: hypothetical protein A2600_07980 [Candidatus Lambdaproteobacteria bacterium RIFOXYD1_FULL_56_27]